MGFLMRMLEEQPFRLPVRTLLKRLPINVRTRERWDAVDRPHYLFGILAAADLAKQSGIHTIYAVEFGVARGTGLLAMQEYAQMVEEETKVEVIVAGFDLGSGLPPLAGDHRDHPDKWVEGDYPMDEKWLRAQLRPGTELILGDVSQTVPEFVRHQRCPLGFMVMDLDLYSSTMQALEILRLPDSKMLRRVFLYFDDILGDEYHRFAGERLAIEDFNCQNQWVKIDLCSGLYRRIFRDYAWIHQMYVAHDLVAVKDYRANRKVHVHPD